MKNMVINFSQLQKELEMINKELQFLPSGHLKMRIKNGKKFYTHLVNDKEVGITNDEKLIRQLARKEYLLARQKQLQNNLTRPISKFDNTSAKELIHTLPPAYRDLPESYFFHPSIEEWITAPYRKNSHPYEDSGGYFSKKGIEFRSKSELIIATLLEELNIPYRYDPVIKLKLSRKTTSPDFIIKNPFTGKTIIWEHFGAFHESKYADKMTNKMGLYLKEGLVPFETIIYTFEFDIKGERRLEYLTENIILS